jgi:mono/diheme cytochrome c family protein
MKRLALLGAALLATAACDGPHLGVPWDYERMVRQPRMEPYGASSLFADGRAMRPPPEGTAARTAGAGSERPAADLALLERGRDRFGVYCSPCHGIDGRAETPVAARLRVRPPPSLHEPRLRELSAAALEQVVAQGYGLMPSYAAELAPRDRWAVACFVKALQLSQSVRLADLPPELRARAQRELGTGGPP